jgi:hypothetical protein
LDFDVDEQSEVEVDLVLLDQWKVAKVKQIFILVHINTIGVADPDPYVFGPPGSGSG